VQKYIQENCAILEILYDKFNIEYVLNFFPWWWWWW